MLGPRGNSNGCVSFRDYNRFLRAYRNGEITKFRGAEPVALGRPVRLPQTQLAVHLQHGLR